MVYQIGSRVLKFESSVTCEEGLAPLQCPFETVPNRHMLSSKSNGHALIYLTLIEMICTIYYVFQNYLANNPLPLQMDLR